MQTNGPTSTENENLHYIETKYNKPTKVIEHNSMSWKSIFAGLLVSLLSYFTLIGLGLGIGGSAVSNMLAGNTFAFSQGASIWFIFSILTSLFIGGYFTARISRYKLGRVGAAEGLVLASLFFIIFLFQVGTFAGMIGTNYGQSIGPGMRQMGPTEELSIPEHNFEISDTNKVQYETEPLPPLEGQQFDEELLEQLENEFSQTVSIAGWTMFFSLSLGSLFCILGGTIGSRVNAQKPLEDMEEDIKPYDPRF